MGIKIKHLRREKQDSKKELWYYKVLNKKGWLMEKKKIAAFLEWDREHIMHSRCPVGENNGIILDKSYGIYFQDAWGKEYIDGASQLLCVNLGYGQRKPK